MDGQLVFYIVVIVIGWCSCHLWVGWDNNLLVWWFVVLYVFVVVVMVIVMWNIYLGWWWLILLLLLCQHLLLLYLYFLTISVNLTFAFWLINLKPCHFSLPLTTAITTKIIITIPLSNIPLPPIKLYPKRLNLNPKYFLNQLTKHFYHILFLLSQPYILSIYYQCQPNYWFFLIIFILVAIKGTVI